MVLAQRPLDLCKIIYEASAPLPQRARVVRPNVRDRVDHQTAGRRALQRVHEERYRGERPAGENYSRAKCAGSFPGQNGVEVPTPEVRRRTSDSLWGERWTGVCQRVRQEQDNAMQAHPFLDKVNLLGVVGESCAVTRSEKV